MVSNPTAVPPIAAASCGRCGRSLRQRDGSCAACDARVLSPQSATAKPGEIEALRNAVRASTGHRVLAALIDLAPALGIAVAVYLTPTASIPRSVMVALAAALLLLYVAAQCADHALTGRTLGKRLLHVRTVSSITGTPRLTFSPRALFAANLAAGPDPLGITYTPLVAFPLPRPSEREALTAARNQVGRTAFVLTFESGLEFYIDREAIIGRGPAQRHATTATARPLVLADLSRTVSNSHVRVIPAEAALLVTDLGSLRGTEVRHPDGSHTTLAPGTPVAVTSGSSIRLGQRVAKVMQAATVAASPVGPNQRPAGGDHRGE